VIPGRLLSNAELLASETVANSCMNRDRGLSGVNSYARELGFDIVDFLQERVVQNGEAFWYDACCGTGRALAQFVNSGEPRAQAVRVLGVDLIGDFVASPASPAELRLVAADVVSFRPESPADLITCVHGIHYLGDKLKFLETVYAALAPGGVFIGHFDPANLRFTESGTDWSRLLRRIRAEGVNMEVRRHRLHMVRNDTPLSFGLVYQGAQRAEGPNFSGMVGVDSWYAALEG
jgi:SAM-dependent methyltransferase